MGTLDTTPGFKAPLLASRGKLGGTYKDEGSAQGSMMEISWDLIMVH